MLTQKISKNKASIVLPHRVPEGFATSYILIHRDTV